MPKPSNPPPLVEFEHHRLGIGTSVYLRVYAVAESPLARAIVVQCDEPEFLGQGLDIYRAATFIKHNKTIDLRELAVGSILVLQRVARDTIRDYEQTKLIQHLTPAEVPQRIVVFIRDEMFYPLQLGIYDDIATHARNNPGTRRVEDLQGNILWPLN